MKNKTLDNNIIKTGELAVVVGSGASGLGAASLLQLMGARVRVLDKKGEFAPAFVQQAEKSGWELVAGEHSPEQFRNASLVIPSPGVPMKVLAPLLEAAGNPLCLAEMELAARFTPESIISITGTSGKTTTTSLIGAMLEESGKKVFLGGNIGTPLSEYVVRRENGGMAADVLVLEVSSFQLQGCRVFHPHVGLMLNLSENHLDQHKDMNEYREAKFSMFDNQIAGDLAIFGEELLPEARARNLRARLFFFKNSGQFKKTRLLGMHNQLNLEAAFLAAGEYGVTLEQAQRAAEKFEPLRHRLETAADKNGVVYVNDSKCTTVEALRVALASFERPVLLLAGGVFKGGDLQSLIPLLRKKVKAVGLYGAGRDIFEPAWKDVVPVSWDEKLAQAFRRMNGLAVSGDAVLLAPATSSYDQYKNYKERGDDFKRLAESV